MSGSKREEEDEEEEERRERRKGEWRRRSSLLRVRTCLGPRAVTTCRELPLARREERAWLMRDRCWGLVTVILQPGDL